MEAKLDNFTVWQDYCVYNMFMTDNLPFFSILLKFD